MACPLSYSASRGSFPRHPKLLESSSLRSVVVLRKASMRFWDSSRLRRSRAGTVCQAAHSISARSNDPVVRCLPVLGSAYPCLLSRDQKGLPLLIEPRTMSPSCPSSSRGMLLHEASKLLQSGTSSSGAGFREIRLRHAKGYLSRVGCHEVGSNSTNICQ